MPKFKASLTKGANWGTVALLVLILASVVMAFYPTITGYAVATVYATLILAICGAWVAIINIQKAEEHAFLISVTALVIIVLSWLGAISMPAELQIFLVNLIVGFGVAGFIVAMGLIIKLSWTK